MFVWTATGVQGLEQHPMGGGGHCFGEVKDQMVAMYFPGPAPRPDVARRERLRQDGEPLHGRPCHQHVPSL